MGDNVQNSGGNWLVGGVFLLVLFAVFSGGFGSLGGLGGGRGLAVAEGGFADGAIRDIHNNIFYQSELTNAKIEASDRQRATEFYSLAMGQKNLEVGQKDMEIARLRDEYNKLYVDNAFEKQQAYLGGQFCQINRSLDNKIDYPRGTACVGYPANLQSICTPNVV